MLCPSLFVLHCLRRVGRCGSTLGREGATALPNLGLAPPINILVTWLTVQHQHRCVKECSVALKVR